MKKNQEVNKIEASSKETMDYLRGYDAGYKEGFFKGWSWYDLWKYMERDQRFSGAPTPQFMGNWWQKME